MNGAITEVLFELGVGERVVGVDVTTVAPASALQVPIVGLGRFITAEGVLGVSPTLVLADSQSGPLAAIDQIRQSGVEVVSIEVPSSFDDLYGAIRRLGAILGAESAAEALVSRIAGEVADAIAEVESTGLRVAYLYTRGPDVMLLFGHGMTTNPMIEAAGAIDAGADSGVQGSIQVTAEGLALAAPDVIIVPAEGLEASGGLEAFLKQPGIASTPAGRSGAVLAYPEGDFLTFGPRVAESLRILIADLNALAR